MRTGGDGSGDRLRVDVAHVGQTEPEPRQVGVQDPQWCAGRDRHRAITAGGIDLRPEDTGEVIKADMHAVGGCYRTEAAPCS